MTVGLCLHPYYTCSDAQYTLLKCNWENLNFTKTKLKILLSSIEGILKCTQFVLSELCYPTQNEGVTLNGNLYF